MVSKRLSHVHSTQAILAGWWSHAAAGLPWRLIFNPEAVGLFVLQRRQRGLAEQEAPHRPDVAEDAVAERGLIQVIHSCGAAGAGAAANDPLDHARVPLSPDEHALFHLHEGVDDLA